MLRRCTSAASCKEVFFFALFTVALLVWNGFLHHLVFFQVIIGTLSIVIILDLDRSAQARVVSLFVQGVTVARYVLLVDCAIRQLLDCLAWLIVRCFIVLTALTLVLTVVGRLIVTIFIGTHLGINRVLPFLAHFI